MVEELLPGRSSSVLTVAPHLQADVILSAEVCSTELVCAGSRELAGRVSLGYFSSNRSRASCVFACPETLQQGR